MSNKGNQKLTDITHFRGLAKRMAYELKTDIDIIETSKAGIGVCFDLIETKKNTGAKVETVKYAPEFKQMESKEAIADSKNTPTEKITDVRNNTGKDILQDTGDEPVSGTSKKTAPKKKAKSNSGKCS